MATINFSSINNTTTMTVNEFITRCKKLGIELTTMTVNGQMAGIGGSGNEAEAMKLIQECIQRNKLNPFTLNNFMQEVAEKVQKTSKPTDEKAESAENANPGIVQLEAAHDDNPMTVKEFIAESKKLGVDLKLIAIENCGCGISTPGMGRRNAEKEYALVGELIRRNHLSAAGLDAFMAEVGKEVAGLNKKHFINFTAHPTFSLSEDVENERITKVTPMIAKWESKDAGIITFEVESDEPLGLIGVEVYKEGETVYFVDEEDEVFANMASEDFDWLKVAKTIAAFIKNELGC